MSGTQAQRTGTGITVAVLTHNEALHLPECLQSSLWADSVLVLDSESTDETRTIAERHGARVVVKAFENFSIQRQVALDLIQTPWVLFVDADERVSPALAAEVRQAVASETADAFWIPRENDFWGHRLRGGGWWPDHQLRLLRVASSHYDSRRAVHELAEVDGTVGTLNEPLFHLNYDSFAEFRSKQRQYSQHDVDRRIAEGESPRVRHVFTQPIREFVRRFITLRGYRDGVLGARLASIMALTERRTISAVRSHRRHG